MIKNFSLSFKLIILFIVGKNLCFTCSSLSSPSLLEELRLEITSQKVPLAISNQLKEEDPAQTILPRELLKSIFNAEVFLFPPVARLNHEWHQWAQPRVSNLHRLFKKLLVGDGIDKTEFYKNALFLLFDQKPTINEYSMRYQIYTSFRKNISDDLTKIENLPIIQDNQDLLSLIPSYQSRDKSFDFQKLMRAGSEYYIYKATISIIAGFWETQKILENCLNGSYKWYEDFNISIGYRGWKTSYISNLIETYMIYDKEFSDSKHFTAPVREIILNIIEVNKLALIAFNKAENFYNNYPDTNTMILYQMIDVDPDQNTLEIRREKFEAIKKKIIECFQQHLAPAELYRRIIQRQLILG